MEITTNQLLYYAFIIGLFDGVGSIDVAIWKRFKSNGTLQPLYVKAFGKSQILPVLKELDKINTTKPSPGLQKIAKDLLKNTTASIDMVAAKDEAGIEKRNQYRIASISKSFIGYIANYLKVNHNLNLDAKVCFCLLYTSPSPRDKRQSRMPSSA